MALRKSSTAYDEEEPVLIREVDGLARRLLHLSHLVEEVGRAYHGFGRVAGNGAFGSNLLSLFRCPRVR